MGGQQEGDNEAVLIAGHAAGGVESCTDDIRSGLQVLEAILGGRWLGSFSGHGLPPRSHEWFVKQQRRQDGGTMDPSP